MYTKTTCPGDYMLSRMDDFIALVNRYLSPSYAKAVWMYPSNGTDAQSWRPLRNADGTYSFESVAKPGYVLDVAGGRMASGMLLQAYPKNGTSAQKFTLRQATDHGYSPAFVAPLEIVPADDSLRLDVKGGSRAPKASLQLYKANNTGAQKFSIFDLGNGTWTIMCPATNTVIDLAGGGA
jgi:hypothetical protein